MTHDVTRTSTGYRYHTQLPTVPVTYLPNVLILVDSSALSTTFSGRRVVVPVYTHNMNQPPSQKQSLEIDDDGIDTSTESDSNRNSNNIDEPQEVVRNPLPSIREPPTDNGMSQELPNSVYLNVVKYYYQTILKYPHIYSGLQFGCHYVLYRDHPQIVHSTYAIYVIHPSTTGTTPEHANIHTNIPWYTIQTLVRMMADLHKTLILLHIEEFPTHDMGQVTQGNSTESTQQGHGITENCSCDTALGTGSTGHETQQPNTANSKIVYYPPNGKSYAISELTITTEHAPFRQQQQQKNNNNSSKIT